MRARLALVVALVPALLLACAAPASRPSTPASSGSAPQAAAPAAPSSSPTSGGNRGSQPPRKLRLAYGFTSAEVVPMWVALDEGIYAKYGLDVEATLLQSSAQVAPAMAAGEIDAALTAGAGVVDIDLAGGDQVIVAAQTNIMSFLLHARPDIRRVEDLRDKRLAITRLGSGIHLASQMVLRQAGLEAGRDVALVQAGTTDAALTALISGAADAALMSAPTNILAEREGFPQLADLKDFRFPYSQTAVAVTRGTLAERTDLVRDFLRAHLEALGVAKRDAALAKRTLGKYMQVDDQEVLDRSYVQWKATLEEWAYPSLPAIQAVLDQRAPDHPAAKTANPSDFVDERLIRELDQSGFLRTALTP
jgi:NitT/TauT family transport system substrate-binding protein